MSYELRTDPDGHWQIVDMPKGVAVHEGNGGGHEALAQYKAERLAFYQSRIDAHQQESEGLRAFTAVIETGLRDFPALVGEITALRNRSQARADDLDADAVRYAGMIADLGD